MKLTKKDHEERVARLADGTSPDPDDDRRLVKLYKRNPQPVDEPVDEPTPDAEARNGTSPRRSRNVRPA